MWMSPNVAEGLSDAAFQRSAGGAILANRGNRFLGDKVKLSPMLQ